VLYARGRERIDAVTGVVEGYEWISVGRARVIGTNEYGIAAEPFDIKRGSPTLKDAVLARIQGPQ